MMKDLHLWELDGRALALLIAVYETGSVTKAAPRLGLSPSAVSHALDRLRHVLGDALFVREGRGISPTAHMTEIVAPARELLDGLERLARRADFDPAAVQGTVVIAANDYQRDLLLPDLFRTLRRDMPGLDLEVIFSGFENVDLLRNRRCDLMLTPNPPDGTEFMQRPILKDRFACFFDPAMTTAPTSLDDYMARDHAKIVFTEDEETPLDRALLATHGRRRISLKVASFAAIASLLPGTDIIATLPAGLYRTTLQHLACAPCPAPTLPLSLHLVWHRRDHDRPLNRHIRSLITAAVATRDSVDSPKT
jgi:DNA-binding transcriptional LysR family regulator